MNKSNPHAQPVLTRSLILVAFAFALFTSAVIPGVVGAVSTFIAESYSSDKPLPANSLASLKSDSTDKVEASTTGNVDTMVGVVIDRSDASISFSNGDQKQVQIAKSGTLNVLVSNINGAVEQGDYITASPVEGVGMRATGSTKVLGIAQNNLENGVTQKIKNDDGSEQEIKVGTVSVLISISGYIEESENSFIPRPVQEIANTLAGRTVSPLPILLSIGVFVVTLIIVTIIIYSMVRNGIISVGRNPLSGSAIYRNIIQLSVLVLGILIATFILIYFILTRM